MKNISLEVVREKLLNYVHQVQFSTFTKLWLLRCIYPFNDLEQNGERMLIKYSFERVGNPI